MSGTKSRPWARRGREDAQRHVGRAVCHRARGLLVSRDFAFVAGDVRGVDAGAGEQAVEPHACPGTAIAIDDARAPVDRLVQTPKAARIAGRQDQPLLPVCESDQLRVLAPGTARERTNG